MHRLKTIIWQSRWLNKNCDSNHVILFFQDSVRHRTYIYVQLSVESSELSWKVSNFVKIWSRVDRMIVIIQCLGYFQPITLTSFERGYEVFTVFPSFVLTKSCYLSDHQLLPRAYRSTGMASASTENLKSRLNTNVGQFK